ncbi:phosphatase PAP2 family protein [Pseudodesulfovibrio sediminis]|uniref:Inositolphosphotransferase Aur1/Ipt1 domain-containing protein n=1 Tax=Pseudodesulfovibrio sediminis TaxID=2810563 RepID=A0ABN6EXS8_9BACT|nr:phosphatase PAP2 family protein [Pseudodesulfovibrio sediminis]BCS89946.1 hypothetical protein PSDVSF_31880 [Pseudodesulfovibrio sediminis]
MRTMNGDMQSFSNIFAHEICMILMLGQILIRLALSSHAYGWMSAYVFVLAVYGVLMFFGRKYLGPLTNRFRLLWNVVVMNFAFTSIKYVVPALGLTARDASLAAIDVSLVGGDLSVWAQQFYSKPMTEIMSLGYMLFIVFLFFSFFYYGIKADLPKLLSFCSGLFVLYAFGITGYTLVPAQGPYAYYAHMLTTPVEGFVFTWLNGMMVAAGSSGYDVFPSLHVGVGLYMLLFFARFDRALWRVYVVPFILLVISTIYLRYHYFIDLVCGASLSLVCFYSCLGFAFRNASKKQAAFSKIK